MRQALHCSLVFLFHLFIYSIGIRQSIDNSEFWTGERQRERERDDTSLEKTWYWSVWTTVIGSTHILVLCTGHAHSTTSRNKSGWYTTAERGDAFVCVIQLQAAYNYTLVTIQWDWLLLACQEFRLFFWVMLHLGPGGIFWVQSQLSRLLLFCFSFFVLSCLGSCTP